MISREGVGIPPLPMVQVKHALSMLNGTYPNSAVHKFVSTDSPHSSSLHALPVLKVIYLHVVF